MRGSTEVLAVVPARGGSKGIPGKNLIPLLGQPLILWTLQAARRAQRLGRTIVSTDSSEIAAVARDGGWEVPFLRPEKISGDDAPMIAVVEHALEWVERAYGSLPGYIMVLQPTSPLRTAEDIDSVIRLAIEHEADSVVAVRATRDHPALLKRIGEGGSLSAVFDDGWRAERRQDMERLYAPNGAVYLSRTDVLLDRGTWYGERTLAYAMPDERSVDIDSDWDLAVARCALRRGEGGSGA